MKKFTAMLILLALLACEKNNLLTPQEVEELITKDIEVIFTTNEPNYDEVMITYYDFSIGTDIAKAYPFEYDIDGNSLPLKIIFENYKYKTIRGEGFRNNFSEAEIKVQLYIDSRLEKERKSNGTSTIFARVNFNYDI